MSRSLPSAILVLTALTLTVTPSYAHDAAAAPTAGRVATSLLTQPLKDVPGKVAQMLVVEYAPGYELPSHTHAGLLYGYVLEGRYITEVEGQPLTTYTKGQAFYEPAGALHSISRNASTTDPLKLLIFVVAEEGKPLTMPVQP